MNTPEEGNNVEKTDPSMMEVVAAGVAAMRGEQLQGKSKDLIERLNEAVELYTQLQNAMDHADDMHEGSGTAAFLAEDQEVIDISKKYLASEAKFLAAMEAYLLSVRPYTELGNLLDSLYDTTPGTALKGLLPNV